MNHKNLFKRALQARFPMFFFFFETEGQPPTPKWIKPRKKEPHSQNLAQGGSHHRLQFVSDSIDDKAPQPLKACQVAKSSNIDQAGGHRRVYYDTTDDYSGQSKISPARVISITSMIHPSIWSFSYSFSVCWRNRRVVCGEAVGCGEAWASVWGSRLWSLPASIQSVYMKLELQWSLEKTEGGLWCDQITPAYLIQTIADPSSPSSSFPVLKWIPPPREKLIGGGRGVTYRRAWMPHYENKITLIFWMMSPVSDPFEKRTGTGTWNLALTRVRP